ncbi:iron uptake system protein EfeO [Galbitalea soli]|uniref:EfeM/EfeO family lipoprotein n=1 Tax=Galbitalea soli TaxID=1268042 RepID=A0A7C9TPC0_9MICO|nr:iron uptake system protein EfeO [Galbitalea soli]NEM90616.1 EfeM/EfeO family lipoprotein [Galbitalea soli]NYJ31334.1 iron uptake system component EfeO [Galbitalea soli]
MTPVHRPRRLAAVGAGTLITALLLAGCASTAGSPGGASTASGSAALAEVVGGASQVRVTLDSSGAGDVCTMSSSRAKAGPVTFTVENRSATGITELELMSDQRILGEKENLVPGLAAVSFTVTLTGRSYQLYCPGASTELQTFTVTGTSTGGGNESVQEELATGTAGYAAYVTQEVDNMAAGVAALRRAIDAGDLTAAQRAYAQARPYYERIETDVDGFVLSGFDATDNAGNLDYLIDMRASNLDPAVGWHGFHAIERDLFGRAAITASTRALAAELVTNVGRLDSLSKTLSYKPEDLANGASDLLEEVQSSKITGEEEAYSHIDLVDFAGNLEGAQQAFAYLKPGLTLIDPALASSVQEEFSTVTELLARHRDASALGGYARYTAALREQAAPGLSRAVEALHERLATIAEKVATA